MTTPPLQTISIKKGQGALKIEGLKITSQRAIQPFKTTSQRQEEAAEPESPEFFFKRGYNIVE